MDPVEERFLAMLREEPSDDTTRLIYADWLEAQGQSDRAAFLRIVCKLAMPNVHRKKAPVLHERLVKLSTASDVAWRALVSHRPIEKCDVELAFKCPRQWSALTTTDDPAVRYCGSCERKVHFCATLEEVRWHGTQRDCVAFDPALRGNPSAVYDRENPNRRLDTMEVEMGEIAR